MYLNKVTLVGNLVADAETREMPSGKVISVFRVATNHLWKDEKTGIVREAVEYHHIITWGKLAKFADKHLRKGMKVYLEGRLETRSWEDDMEVKRYMTEIIADKVKVVENRDGSEVTDKDLIEKDITL